MGAIVTPRREPPQAGHAPSSRGNTADDRLCAGQGGVVYAVPATDHAPYTLRVFDADAGG